jgi:lipid-binding SYLF domain-containing protein
MKATESTGRAVDPTEEGSPVRDARDRRRRRRIAAALMLAALATMPWPARASDLLEAQQLVEKARHSLESFRQDPNLEAFRSAARRAVAMLVVPQALRAAFLFGGSGGSGVMMAKDAQSEAWRGPAFYTIGGASFGFQAGVDVSEVVILVLSEGALRELLNPTVKLSAGAGAAVGPVGAGAAAATAGFSADLVVYSRAKGLYGGFAVDGAIVGVRDQLNRAYYGKPVTTGQILIQGEAQNPHARELAAAAAAATTPVR